MRVTCKQRGNVFVARRAGYAGKFFGMSETEATYRAQMSKPDHRASRECVAVWQPFVGVLSKAAWFQQNF
jgi:hypothetical protein